MENQQEKEILNEVKHLSGRKLSFYVLLIFLCFGIFGVIIPAFLLPEITGKSFGSYPEITKIILVIGYSLMTLIPLSYIFGRNNKNSWKKELKQNIDLYDHMIERLESQKQEVSDYYQGEIEITREKIESYKKDFSLDRKEIISRHVDLLKKKDADLEDFYKNIESVPDGFVKITGKKEIEDLFQEVEDWGLDEISCIHKDDEKSLKGWDELFEKISSDYQQAIVETREKINNFAERVVFQKKVYENLLKQIEHGHS